MMVEILLSAIFFSLECVFLVSNVIDQILSLILISYNNRRVYCKTIWGYSQCFRKYAQFQNPDITSALHKKLSSVFNNSKDDAGISPVVKYI